MAAARLIFLRIIPSRAIADICKQKKQLLAQDGFDPAATGDPLYADCGAGYVPPDMGLYARINSGLIRL